MTREWVSFVFTSIELRIWCIFGCRAWVDSATTNMPHVTIFGSNEWIIFLLLRRVFSWSLAAARYSLVIRYTSTRSHRVFDGRRLCLNYARSTQPDGIHAECEWMASCRVSSDAGHICWFETKRSCCSFGRSFRALPPTGTKK